MDKLKRPQKKEVISLNMPSHFVYNAKEMDAYIEQLKKEAVYYKEMWMREDERADRLSKECQKLQDIINNTKNQEGGGNGRGL